MKAICVKEFGGPEVLCPATVDQPAPGAGQVLVRIHAAGVNPVETYIRSGQYANLPDLPWTPGTDGAGVVEAVGEGVTHVEPGTRVYLSNSLTGTYAEFSLAVAEHVHVLPEGLSFSQGAALGVPYVTAWRALLQRARAVAGESVLVHGGSGGVGLAAVQIAHAAGLRVIATAGSEAGRALVKAQGADLVLDHHSDGRWQQIMDYTGGQGVDVVLEMLANENLGKDLQILAGGGRVAIIGSRGPVEINPRDAMAREAEILGVLLWKVSAEDRKAIHAGLHRGLQDGSLKPVVAMELPLEEAAKAHELVMQSGAQGKIVLTT